MGNYFIDEKLRRKFEKDIEKRAALEKQEAEHVKEFIKIFPFERLKDFVDAIVKKGYPKDAEKAQDIFQKLDNSMLTANDILEMNDLYEKYVDEIRK